MLAEFSWSAMVLSHHMVSRLMTPLCVGTDPKKKSDSGQSLKRCGRVRERQRQRQRQRQREVTDSAYRLSNSMKESEGETSRGEEGGQRRKILTQKEYESRNKPYRSVGKVPTIGMYVVWKYERGVEWKRTQTSSSPEERERERERESINIHMHLTDA